MVDATIPESLLTIAKFLGFIDPWSTIWNIIAYATSIVVVWTIRRDDEFRNKVITLCALILALYADIFLGNPVFMSLQMLIVISGGLVWMKMPPLLSRFTTLAIATVAYVSLFAIGAIKFKIWPLDDFLIFVGPLGLVCIAFALTTFPKNLGFLLFAIGGALLAAYIFAAKAWVFFGLYVIFALISMRDYVLKTRASASARPKNQNSWYVQKIIK